MISKRLIWILGLILILLFIVGTNLITLSKFKKVEAGVVVLQKETKLFDEKNKIFPEQIKRLEDLNKRLEDLNRRLEEANKTLESFK